MYQKYEDTQVELESAYDLEDFSLGWTEQTVFRPDRKFKIRLKSKKTGKKIDFNVRFTRKHEKIITKYWIYQDKNKKDLSTLKMLANGKDPIY